MKCETCLNCQRYVDGLYCKQLERTIKGYLAYSEIKIIDNVLECDNYITNTIIIEKRKHDRNYYKEVRKNGKKKESKA